MFDNGADNGVDNVADNNVDSVVNGVDNCVDKSVSESGLYFFDGASIHKHNAFKVVVIPALSRAIARGGSWVSGTLSDFLGQGFLFEVWGLLAMVEWISHLL